MLNKYHNFFDGYFLFGLKLCDGTNLKGKNWWCVFKEEELESESRVMDKPSDCCYILNQHYKLNRIDYFHIS